MGEPMRSLALILLTIGWLSSPLFCFAEQTVTSAHQVALPKNGDGSEVQVSSVPQSGYGKHYAFPEIKNWNSLHVTFARTACMGTCPDYIVEIWGNGTLHYNGRECVQSKGEHVSHISQAQVRALFTALKDADFFSLLDSYNVGTFDAPGISISLQYDEWRKYVVDAVDTEGMPKSAALLPGLIDRVTQTERWVGNPEKGCGFR